MDMGMAILLLLLLFPVMLLVILAIGLAGDGPVFFRQVRPGQHEKPFTLYKFRTMTNRFDENGVLLPDAQRLTRLGRWLRALSLDELPQLINVLKGDMSFVGPRPLLMEYLPLYNDRQRLRHRVKPGITGWAQVNGRNLLNWNERFDLDIWYVAHWSLRLDIKILCLTIVKILKREGISGEGSVTMEKFKGNGASYE